MSAETLGEFRYRYILICRSAKAVWKRKSDDEGTTRQSVCVVGGFVLFVEFDSSLNGVDVSPQGDHPQ